MRTWIIESQTGIGALRLVEKEKPSLNSGEVLVRMTAPAVVPLDSAIICNDLKAEYPPALLPVQLGNQGAGVVDDPGHSSFARGDRVMFGTFASGFWVPGSWAEFVAVSAADLARIPASVTDGAAAQAVVAYPTAYAALLEAGFAPGKTVLATAIGGSVGNAAYQLALALGASRVFATAGSSTKAERAKAAGFDAVIDLSSESMVDGVMRLNKGQGVDIVIDSVGGAVTAQAVPCLGRYGVIMTLGFVAGRTSTINLVELIGRRGRVQGLGVHSSTPEFWQEAWARFTQLADEGKIKPLFDRSFPFEEVAQALQYINEAKSFGAVALSL